VTGAVKKLPTQKRRSNGRGKKLIIAAKQENWKSVTLARKSTGLFPNGGVYSLTRDLLMGDPFSHLAGSGCNGA